MANKAPKKKESREHVNQTSISKEAAITASSLITDVVKKKPTIPLWVEWNDQDIANEKWDNGKQTKDRGRSPTSLSSCFEDGEGKIDLPPPIKARVHSWKRPCEIFNDKIPTMVNPDYIYEPCIDLLGSNEHITDSELFRHILSTLTSLYEIFASTNEPEAVSSIIKMKASLSKDNKDARLEKGKRDEHIDEMGWRPWYQIWPKEGAKGNNVPCYNPQGKYAVKIFWMGCYRKIIVDDTVPCDEDSKPLLPMTARGNEIWLLILAKALIKVASLDYYGGLSNSEFGDSNIIHCLTGWLPESVPLETKNSEKIWNLLLNLLPHWTLPLPLTQKCDDSNLENKKSDIGEVEVSSKQELGIKESKDKQKKEEKGKDDKRTKTTEKVEKDNKANKEKPMTPANVLCKKVEQPTPDVLLFATFLNPPNSDPPCKFSDFKEMANISGKLRQFGLCQYLSHPVHLNSIRICPIVPPPEPLKIPRWRLIRQKKNRELVEPKLRPEEKEKEPKFLELKSTFFNFKVNTGDTGSPMNKKKSLTKISSISEEVQDEDNGGAANDNGTETSIPNTEVPEVDVSNVDGEGLKSINRSLSITSSQGSQTKKGAKSKQDNRKSAQKEKNMLEKKDSNNPPPPVEEPENPDIAPETIDGSIETTCEDDIEKEKEKEDTKESVVWMDFDDFLQCFSTLWVYHKPKKNIKNIADIKCFEQKTDKARKSGGHTAAEVKNVPSPLGIFGGITSDSLPPFLLIDCVQQAEIVIHFSAFSRWFDPNLEFTIKKEGTENDGDLRKALTPIPGTLMVEPYFWKQIITPSPLLRLSTTGVKSAVLTLPPGRHVLRFMINTPLGYHICITSAQTFIFDDEHVVMQHLTKVSTRFATHAVEVFKQLKVISQSFNDRSIPRSCAFTIGTENKAGYIRSDHFESLYKCIAATLQSELGDNFQTKMRFALNALKYETYFHIPRFPPECKRIRSKSVNDTIDPIMLVSSAKERYSLPAMQTLTGSDVREVASIKLQSTFKGFYLRKLRKAFLPDSKENKMVNEMFDKIWSCIDVNIEAFATKVYLKLFDEKPNLYTLFPFYADECNKVKYNDYNGSYPEPSNVSWFLIFREIFYVLDSNLIYPKFYCNIQNNQLKIVDNDTTEELKDLFSKVVPQVLNKNKHGYTFVATAWSQHFVPNGKFRLRIIGANDGLPIPIKENVTTNFVTKEIKDYYLPNRYDRIFRQTVKSSEDVLSSIQFTTSKEDVYIKVQVVDDEEIIYTCEGKRSVVIPALIFYKDRFPPADDSRNSRSSSQAGSVGSISKSTNTKQSTRRTSSPEKHKKKMLQLADLNMEEDILEEQVHKYIIEGFVLRDSWPLTRKEWIFAENQKNVEKLDKEASTDSVSKTETVGRGSAGKSRKTTRQDSRGTKNRPPSQTQNTFDTTKANWTLRFIIDANMENAIEIKRDTQRDEEIKAIKAAWESLEPGRSTKASLSRQKYLETHTIVLNNNVEENEEESTTLDGYGSKGEEEAASIVTSEPVTASNSPLPSEPDSGELFDEPPMKENLPVLMTFDTTPYIRSNGKKVILDEYEEEMRQKDLQSKFSNFHQVREMVLQMRENNRISRNLEKEKQLAEYEKMQVQLDEARIGLYKAREDYRNKFIPQPSAEAEAELDKRKKTPSPKAKASKSKAKKK